MQKTSFPTDGVTQNDKKRTNATATTVTVHLQPEEKDMVLARPKTVSQLLASLGLAEETALVARDGQLLTPDRHIWPNDILLVRKVASSG
ncbi:MAG: hypothetical protein J5861_00155 [Desulfovibrio sp.]|nr:hypothetical protein [Desulfovibrio sp.]